MESLWPEAASITIPVAASAPTLSYPIGERPTLLLSEPQPLRERDTQLWWRKRLDILSGPERLSSPPERGHVQYRDYFIAREASGSICWIFRELNSGRWFVHGLFA